MKKKMKQFLAAMMAVVMVLSLCVTAGATTSSGDTGPAFSALSGDEVTNNAAVELPKSGSLTAKSNSEGPMPEDPVEVVFPTIPAKQARNDGMVTASADSFGVYDIILDPHQLIRATNGLRYQKEGISKTFTDSRLYFLNSFDEDSQVYANESAPLKISNKGRKPVNVNLSVDFDYDKNYITLVSGGGVHVVSGDDPNGSAGAEMMFALKYGTLVSGDMQIISGDSVVSGSMMVVSGDSTASGGGGIVYVEEPEDGATPYITVSGKGDYIEAPNATDSVVGVNFVWTNSGDTIVDSLKGFNVKLSYLPAKPLMSGDTLQNGYITVTPKAPTGYSAIVSGDVQLVSGDTVDSSGTIGSGDTAAVSSGGDIEVILASTASGDVATVTLTLKDPNSRTMKATTTSGGNFDQIVQFKKRGVGAFVETTLAGNEAAYKQYWTNKTGTEAPQGITDAGYYWEFRDNTTDFPTMTFSLTGDVNNDNTWDALNINPKVNFELIWDVMQHSTYYKNVKEVGVPETLVKTATGTIPVTVKTKSTAKVALVLTIGTPSGDAEGFTPKLKTGTTNKVEMKLSNDKTIELTLNGTTLTATGTTSNVFNDLAGPSTTGTIAFEKTGYKDITVTVSAMRA